jgi:protein-arginine kinase
LGIDPNNHNEEAQAAGINEDWPVGRGVFIQDQKNFVVLVNFEQHIKIIVLKDSEEPNDNMFEGIKRLFKMIQMFEKLGFSTDPYLGNLTVSPKDLGTGMKLQCTLDLEGTNNMLDRDILMKLKHESKMSYTAEGKSLHNLETHKTLAPACNEML